ncbi:MAG TPA: hypothetical protein EYP80_03065 [Candidatus Aenigmarchaeota archaeon]|nr:hypothetical protein [Candidatus Aenigmarchaeota archaeon]
MAVAPERLKRWGIEKEYNNVIELLKLCEEKNIPYGDILSKLEDGEKQGKSYQQIVEEIMSTYSLRK